MYLCMLVISNKERHLFLQRSVLTKRTDHRPIVYIQEGIKARSLDTLKQWPWEKPRRWRRWKSRETSTGKYKRKVDIRDKK
jgi:hypothetical protein